MFLVELKIHLLHKKTYLFLLFQHIKLQMDYREGNQTTSEPQPVDFKEFY